MKIKYVENVLDGTKLFSTNRHDYKEYKDKDDNYMMIDGGFDYYRYSVDDKVSFLRESSLEEVIGSLRGSFKWGRNYDKDMNKLLETEYILLKDLERDHIYNILKYFTKPLTDGESHMVDANWGYIHMVFIQELIYRFENDLE